MTAHYTTRTTCRLCGGDQLAEVIDLGVQPLAGRFPRPDEPDPPAAPLVLARCADPCCGLVQLRHTVRPDEMFRDYWYRSSISDAMKAHLADTARVVCDMLASRVGEKCQYPRFLDVGSNDGLFLHLIPATTVARIGIDPSDVPNAYPEVTRIKGFFPQDLMLHRQFDCVSSLACFYDSDDPVAFAKAVKKVLAPNGLWVVEVADLAAMLRNVDYSAVCHEHLIYLSAHSMTLIARQAEMKIVRADPVAVNGGSVRYFLTHRYSTAYEGGSVMVGDLWSEGARIADGTGLAEFAAAVVRSRDEIREYVRGKRVHLLAASTKSNTVLNYAGLTAADIEAASDRDDRKAGRVTPGGRIPIVGEQASRDMRPDAYLCCLSKSFFGPELERRESSHLDRGGQIMFPMPEVQITRRAA